VESSCGHAHPSTGFSYINLWSTIGDIMQSFGAISKYAWR
jgi:hypothetical protein